MMKSDCMWQSNNWGKDTYKEGKGFIELKHSQGLMRLRGWDGSERVELFVTK